MRQIHDLKKDINSIFSAYSNIIENAEIFGSYLRNRGTQNDIDIAIKIKKGESIPPLQEFFQLKLTLPVVNIDVDGYKRWPGRSAYGYHFLLLSTAEAKRIYNDKNKLRVMYQV